MLQEDDPSMPFMNDTIINKNEIPPPTKWENKCTFLGLQLNFIPSEKKYFLNQWMIRYIYPIGVLFVIFSSYAVILTCVYPNVNWLDRKIIIPLTIFMILFASSYIATILVGPGYLPYYYPLKLNGNNPKDHLSGYVSRQDQLEFVHQRQYPTRVKYFNSVRRLVIRPDHLCAWTSCFIGKKNHKLFFLFNMWGVIYIGLFNYCIIRALFISVLLLQVHHQISLFLIVFLYAILGISFFLLTGTFLLQNLKHVTENRTQFEIMTNTPPQTYRKGKCIENWEEICGSTRKWYTWPFPIPAFCGIDDYSLATYDCAHDEHGFP